MVLSITLVIHIIYAFNPLRANVQLTDHLVFEAEV